MEEVLYSIDLVAYDNRWIVFQQKLDTDYGFDD